MSLTIPPSRILAALTVARWRARLRPTLYATPTTPRPQRRVPRHLSRRYRSTAP